MADPLPRPSTPRAPYTFDVATGVVAAGDGAWTATIDPGWGIGDRPNGGYLLALAARAALAASGPGETAHPDPSRSAPTSSPRPRPDRPSCPAASGSPS
jgi:hypothetical protein